MSLFLAIETATTNCSVALFSEDKLIAYKEQGGEYSHAENLAVFVDELLQETGSDKSNLKAIIIGKGPGSYTGLRIGVSFAKGLCYALEIPLIAIDSLFGLAVHAESQIKGSNALLCPMIDARRMEVYTCLYDNSFNMVQDISAKVIEENTFQEQLKHQKIYFFGNGSEKCKETIIHENAIFLAGIETSAKFLGRKGIEKFKASDFEDLAYFEPFYLKEFMANKPKKLL